MTLFQIKSRFDGRVLFELECGSLKVCVEAAVKARANLAGADLAGADLARAYLAGADLADADLADANLADADLADANLAGADLARAYLAGADLARAYLAGANLAGAKNIPPIAEARTTLLPEGSLIGWKKLVDGRIAKLRIPEHAARSSASGRKCRASEAEVLAIFGADGVMVEEGRSQHNSKFLYRVGATVKPDSWCEDRWRECAGGIHFFITRLEAEAY